MSDRNDEAVGADIGTLLEFVKNEVSKPSSGLLGNPDFRKSIASRLATLRDEIALIPEGDA